MHHLTILCPVCLLYCCYALDWWFQWFSSSWSLCWMIVLLNSESLDWFLASRLIILYLSHAYTNLSEPLWLKKIVGFTNKEAEKIFWLVIYKLQQGSLAVLGNFVNTKKPFHQSVGTLLDSDTPPVLRLLTFWKTLSFAWREYILWSCCVFSSILAKVVPYHF